MFEKVLASVKVTMSEILVVTEMSCHKEHLCEISKL